MKRPLFVLLPLLLLSSCGAPAPDANAYFSAYEVAANALKQTKAIAISSNATSLKASLVDKEGDPLDVSTTPLAFSLRCDDISATSIDNASIAFTMANASNTVNKLTLSGAYLKKMTKVFSGGSISCDVNLYAIGGNAYVDFKSSSMVRTLLSEALVNAGYPKIQSNTIKLVFLDAEGKAKADEYLPLTKYFDDATSSRLTLFRDLYAANPNGFTFGDDAGNKTIAFTSNDKERTKSIAKDLIKDEEAWKKVDQYFSYCTNLSLEYAVTFNDKGPLSTSFAFNLSGFDKEAIEKDNPDAKLFPSGSWKIATKLDFSYPTDKITFPNFGSYREYELGKASTE